MPSGPVPARVSAVPSGPVPGLGIRAHLRQPLEKGGMGLGRVRRRGRSRRRAQDRSREPGNEILPERALDPVRPPRRRDVLNHPGENIAARVDALGHPEQDTRPGQDTAGRVFRAQRSAG